MPNPKPCTEEGARQSFQEELTEKRPTEKIIVCPVMSHGTMPPYAVRCSKDGCAWWVPEEEVCALVVLANTLKACYAAGFEILRICAGHD